MSKFLDENKSRLIQEYQELTGHDLDINAELILNGLTEEIITLYEWQLTGNQTMPCKLVKKQDDDPFAIPEADTNFGVGAQPNHAEYTDDPFDSPLVPDTLRAYSSQPTSAREIMTGILPIKERDKLLLNHNQNSSASARQILEGFGMDNLIDAYAENLSNENICRYLKISPGQLNGWLAMSQQRLALVAQLKDVMRASRVNKTLDDALDYQVGEVMDKHDAALETIRVNAMKMRSGVALNLDQRSRGQNNGDGAALPTVNLGLQVNVNTESGKDALDHATPVIPGVTVKRG